MKIVVLEAASVGKDISFEQFREFGELVVYDVTTQEELPSRVEDADIIILNKLKINKASVGKAKHLKLVCLTATGSDNLDKDYLDANGIAWRNVAGYSTDLVAQHTFALLFYLMENLRFYDDYVKNGDYTRNGMFSYFDISIGELAGKTYGIIGMGAIGQKVAQIATAFGCHVIYYSTSGANKDQPYEQVSFEELLSRADVVSVHAPLNNNTYHLMDYEAFCQMKQSAIFINVGRGAIVEEAGLAKALKYGQIQAAGLDVLSTEPMPKDHPLYGWKDSRLIITPHIAWAGYETRCRLVDRVAENIREFLKSE